MKPWPLAASAAALALLVVAARRPDLLGLVASSSAPPDAADQVDPWAVDDGQGADLEAPPSIEWTDQVAAYALELEHFIVPTPATDMQPSERLRAHLKGFERLALTPYRLGDGGYTLGWGRFFPDGGSPPPERIDLATADAWFDEDIEARGARWVRAYVTVPLTQGQFDALTSMAYNLRPSSFKTIAEAVNRGEDPEAAALQYVRAGTNLERGLRRRRAAELAMYRDTTYTA